MIRHCSLWKFKPNAPTDLVSSLTDRFHRTFEEVASVRTCEAGANVGLKEGNYDFAVVLDFDDLGGYDAYVDDPYHRALFEELLRPYYESRIAVQFPLHDAGKKRSFVGPRAR